MDRAAKHRKHEEARKQQKRDQARYAQQAASIPDLLQYAVDTQLRFVWVGRMGLNADGIGLCTNTLIADQGRPEGVPYNVLLRGALNARTLDAAIGALIRPEPAICSNYQELRSRSRSHDDRRLARSCTS